MRSCALATVLCFFGVVAARAGGYAPLAVPTTYTDAQAQAANAVAITAAQGAAQTAAVASVVSQFPTLLTSNCGSVVCSVNGKFGIVTTATLPGTYTVQNGGSNPLPNPSANSGRYANASDVGGVAVGGGSGFAQLYSTGTCWKRTSPYVVPLVVTPTNNTITIVALQQSPILQVSGTGIASTVNMTVSSACPGDVFTLEIPSGVFSVLGSIGLSVNSAAVLSLTGLSTGVWGDYVYTGASVQKIRGGSL